METDYMEALARAYNSRLSGITKPANLEEAYELIEQQLKYIDCLLSLYKPSNRSLAYLKGLKQASQRELIALGAGGKVPGYAQPLQERCRSPIDCIVDLQIELFISLDTLREDGVTVDALICNEQRALGIIALL